VYDEYDEGFIGMLSDGADLLTTLNRRNKKKKRMIARLAIPKVAAKVAAKATSSNPKVVAIKPSTSGKEMEIEETEDSEESDDDDDG
jgi:hypothetical protein